MSWFLRGFLALGVATLGACKSEDMCGAACGAYPFEATAAFEAGSAAQLKFQLCHNAGCTIAVSADNFAKDGKALAEAGESPAFLWASFSVFRSDGGPSTLGVSAWPRGKLANGDGWSISVLDADSGAVLFAHADSVTYERHEVCGQQCVSARIEVDGGTADAAINQ